MGAVTVRRYGPPPVDRREILRYAGVRGDAPEVEALLEDCLCELEGRLSFRVCLAEFFPERRERGVELGFAYTDSVSLQKHLEGCERVVVFAATVGAELDRLITRYGRLSPARALLLQAIGAERIEALCDLLCAELAAEAAERGLRPRPRFSPGYGDLPLALQRPITETLGCDKRIGVSLNESLLLSPSKSVTALVGLERID